MPREEEFYTMDNGGCPFIVVWKPEKKIVEIYIALYGYSTLERWRGRQVARYEQVRQFLVGNCPKYPDWKGNTILFSYTSHDEDEEEPELTLPSFRYVWVGDSIIEFDLPERVIYYVSPVGNSGCPGPYGVTKSKTYLFGLQGNVQAIENGKLPYTPPTYAEYADYVVSDSDDSEVRQVDPRCWVSDQVYRDQAACQYDVLEAVPVTTVFERGSGNDEAYAYGCIMEGLEKHRKRTGLVTCLALTAIGLWVLTRAMC